MMPSQADVKSFPAPSYVRLYESAWRDILFPRKLERTKFMLSRFTRVLSTLDVSVLCRCLLHGEFVEALGVAVYYITLRKRVSSRTDNIPLLLRQWCNGSTLSICSIIELEEWEMMVWLLPWSHLVHTNYNLFSNKIVHLIGA